MRLFRFKFDLHSSIQKEIRPVVIGIATSIARRSVGTRIAAPGGVLTEDASRFRKPVIAQMSQDSSANLGPPGFTWCCRMCGTVNDGSQAQCENCNQHLVPDTWMCNTCSATNFKLRNTCFSCNAPIDPSWMCKSCRKGITSIYDMCCRFCGTTREKTNSQSPKVIGKAVPKSASWICRQCKKLNFGTKSACFSCKAERLESPNALEDAAGMNCITPVGDANWQCGTCHANNFRTREDCWQCRTPRPPGVQAPDKGSEDEIKPGFEVDGFQRAADGSEIPAEKVYLNAEVLKEGEWICSSCFFRNYRSQGDCVRCFQPKSAANVSAKAIHRAKKRRDFKI